MKKLMFTILSAILCITLFAQNKIKIEKAEDLPKHYYNLEENKAIDYINNSDLCIQLANKVKADLKADLEKYDIQDIATMRGYHNKYITIAFINNDFKTALQEIEAGLKLTEKESDKYMWNIIEKNFIRTKLNTTIKNDTEFRKILYNNISAELEAAPYEVIKEDVESLVGTVDLLTENIYQGIVEGQLQPIIDKSKNQVPGFVVMEILNTKMTYDAILPYVNDTYQPVFQNLYDKNHVEVKMVDIWNDRDANLNEIKNLNPVVIGIWDAGVDENVFQKNNQWINPKEKADGKDSDGNGFIDDIHGIAFDIEGNPVSEILFPAKELNPEIEKYDRFLKGLLDLQAAVKSKEADELKKYMASMEPSEVNPALENLSMYSNYVHGTHVAGIAAKNNPSAQIMAARITFPYVNIPPPPTLETSEKWAKLYKNAVQYFQNNNVKVVNMSWGYSQNYYENLLAMNGVGETEEERKNLAIKLFSIEKEALYLAMKNAPEILFVAAAGNANNDIDFANNIPSGFNLPNLLKVGAVDIEGKETGFTTMGKGVDIYSNGYEVESYVPGGEIRKLSGTSMASPQVVNLAGKIWAMNPDLTVEEVKNLIIKGATPSKDNPDILLIHPKSTLELVKK